MSKDEFIHEQFMKIKNKLIPEGKVGFIYGIQVDPENIEHMVLSAYFLAKQEELDKKMKEMSNLF